MTAIPQYLRATFIRILAVGTALAVLSGAAAVIAARAQLGDTDQAAVARVEADVRQRFNRSTALLDDLASRVSGAPQIATAGRDTDAAEELFARLAAALPAKTAATTGITIYDAALAPVAWAGRVVDLPRIRLVGPPVIFVVADALGPRLVRILPIADRTRPNGPRLATIVAEQILGDVTGVPDPGEAFVLTGGAVPVSLRARVSERTSGSPYTFVVTSADGQPLVEASVDPQDLAAARARWRQIAEAILLGFISLTLIACASPLIDLRRRAARPRGVVVTTLGLLAIIALVRAATWRIARTLLNGSALAGPFGLLASALTLGTIVWLTLDLVERRRFARPHSRLLAADGSAAFLIAVTYVAAGAVNAAALWTYEHYLAGLIDRTGLDVLRFSLHPLSGPRIATSFALVILHAGVIWSGALVLRLAEAAGRRPRVPWLRATAVVSWMAGIAAASVLAMRLSSPVPLVPLGVALAFTGLCAVALSRPRGRFRRSSQASRLGLFYLGAVLVPALALYPSIAAFATAAKERVVATTFGPQAISQREELQRELNQTLDQIDAMPDLSTLVADTSGADAPAADQAFTVWSRTVLREHRTTSAVELYGPARSPSASGRLVDRFALNLPGFTITSPGARNCGWLPFEEVTSFAAAERHVLRATRGICNSSGLVTGTIVVRAMLDYRTLPFISSQRPYVESLRPPGSTPEEAAPGRDVEFTVYGWSRAPLFTFGNGVTSLPDSTFTRLVQSRQPFWDTLVRDDGRRYQVYFLNNQYGIYALGYPATTITGHLINIAELIVLTLLLSIALVTAFSIVNALTSSTAATGRALLREVRSSFYRKLWLAFVGVAIVPVLILAFATRTYFVNQFRAGVEEDAVKTVTVAQRLVEDYSTLEQRGAARLEVFDDLSMVLVSQAIDQDVSLFDPRRLQATSQRDLYASGVLSPRTPGDVYRSIALARLPTFVGQEEVAGSPYYLAAAPVRSGDRLGILTVPLTLRAQEADEQIDDLDRQVRFAAVLFVLLGAALGYWMAERIADPVSRLTRATRRIARGDLDARIAATSSDELRRLVEDFNRMAADLKRQRHELERTQRLEAWAEMARQVAHDIKNPLTPIQLSAEHARRVNIDKGRPLSPVLDECITSILSQVKLLRQISAEFSSFASSPTARPEPTNLPALIEEVIEPYRTGLAGRIAIDVTTEADPPMVAIDRTLFSRAVTNIIENALYAMPGGGRLAIHTQQSASGNQHVIRVSVTDTGVGMDRDALDRIFEPYFSTKATGTGLGLTIAKRNIELNGGTIRVESERGAGTRVTITLPLSERRDAEGTG